MAPLSTACSAQRKMKLALIVTLIATSCYGAEIRSPRNVAEDVGPNDLKDSDDLRVKRELIYDKTRRVYVQHNDDSPVLFGQETGQVNYGIGFQDGYDSRLSQPEYKEQRFGQTDYKKDQHMSQNDYNKDPRVSQTTHAPQNFDRLNPSNARNYNRQLPQEVQRYNQLYVQRMAERNAQIIARRKELETRRNQLEFRNSAIEARRSFRNNGHNMPPRHYVPKTEFIQNNYIPRKPLSGNTNFGVAKQYNHW